MWALALLGLGAGCVGPRTIGRDGTGTVRVYDAPPETVREAVKDLSQNERVHLPGGVEGDRIEVESPVGLYSWGEVAAIHLPPLHFAWPRLHTPAAGRHSRMPVQCPHLKIHLSF